MFLVVKAAAKMEKPKEAPAPTTKECPFCKSQIPIQATRCPSCTSELLSS
jgi:large conductance mechanosensitive channel